MWRRPLGDERFSGSGGPGSRRNVPQLKRRRQQREGHKNDAARTERRGRNIRVVVLGRMGRLAGIHPLVSVARAVFVIAIVVVAVVLVWVLVGGVRAQVRMHRLVLALDDLAAGRGVLLEHQMQRNHEWLHGKAQGSQARKSALPSPVLLLVAHPGVLFADTRLSSIEADIVQTLGASGKVRIRRFPDVLVSGGRRPGVRVLALGPAREALLGLCPRGFPLDAKVVRSYGVVELSVPRFAEPTARSDERCGPHCR